VLSFQVRRVVFFAFSFILSCGGQKIGASPTVDQAGAGADTVAAGTGLPCDVARVLQRSCWQCHGASPRYGAPTSLATYDALVARAQSAPNRKLYELLHERVRDASKPMPPPPNAKLADADLAVLDAWTRAGAPRDTDACDTNYESIPGTQAPLSCAPDTRFRAPKPWEMPTSTRDEYVCYGIDIDVTKKRHVTGLAAHVDNPAIVHHILLFQADESVDPAPKACAAFGSLSWRLVAGWAPGSTNLELPLAAGFPENVGKTHWVVQVHYNNLGGLKGQRDASGYDLCTTEALRPNDADVIAFGAMGFTLPARAATTITCDATVSTDVPLHFFSAWPHMHTLGTSLTSWHIPEGSETPRMFASQPKWNFGNQLFFGVDVVYNPGDRVRTNCSWNNPTDKRVRFGEDTENEMCFNFVAYYPKANLSTWALPSALARCGVAP
jgi:hypothetical protein